MQYILESFFRKGHFQNQLTKRLKNLPKLTDAESCGKLKNHLDARLIILNWQEGQ